MRTAEFLEVYPRDLTTTQIHHGATIPEVQASQLYSYGYGHVLFDALSGNREGLPGRVAQLGEYESLVDFGTIEGALLDDPNGWSYRNEVNFYGLNYHMEKMWAPLINGDWPKEKGSKYAGHFSMNGLALEALKYYSLRERFTREHGTEILYTDEMRPMIGRLTGVMQEFDATIVVLNWAKKYANLTVVPAPAQFEHSVTGANADLLVVDFVESRTVGVQVKTTADEETRARYDPDRIVVIDSKDLGNVRMVRTQKGRDKETPRPWPGIIAASRVDGIQTRGNPDVNPAFFPYLVGKKMEALMQLGKLRADYNEVSAAIGKKILEKL